MRKPTEGIDYTSRDYEAYRELLLEELQKKMPEYTDTSETDAGIVILEALANGLDILSLYADVVANDVVLPTTQDRRMAVVLARCLGYLPYNSSAARHLQVFVLSAPQERDVLVPAGTAVSTKEDSSVATQTFETVEDLVIPKGSLGDEKDGKDYRYAVAVEHGTTIRDDVVGSSSGAPLQAFQLKYAGVLADSVRVFVNEGDGDSEWERVDTFLDCDVDSKAFMVLVDEFDVCSIEFGNGVKGRIPLAYENGITATYRVGGGVAGNVPEGTITKMVSGVPFVDRTFNAKVLSLGREKEGLESIKQNAPAAYRTRDRLVTLGDYEDLLRINFPHFLAVKAVRDETDRKTAHLYYMLNEGYEFDVADEVREFVEGRCMIGTSYDIQEYARQEVDVTATLYMDKDYDQGEVEADVRRYLSEVSFRYGSLLFGDSVVKSELEDEVRRMFPAVLSFRMTLPEEDIISPSAEQNVLALGEVTLNTTLI